MVVLTGLHGNLLMRRSDAGDKTGRASYAFTPPPPPKPSAAFSRAPAVFPLLSIRRPHKTGPFEFEHDANKDRRVEVNKCVCTCVGVCAWR